MPFTKRGSKGRRLDTSSKRKRKYTRPNERQSNQHQPNQATWNESIASLISESSIQPDSDSDTIILSSDSEDSTLEFNDRKARRIAIAFQFTNILQSPPKSQWTAAAKLISENLRIKTVRLQQMYNIFQDCMLCNDGNTLYTGDRKKYLELKNTMIPTDSPIAHIITNAVEDGWSERQAVVIANQYLLEQSQDFITHNQLRSLVYRMKPVVSAIEKAKQGSSDPDAPWSKARYN